MDFAVIKHEHSSKLNYYLKSTGKIDEKYFALLGFKDNLPVVETYREVVSKGEKAKEKVKIIKAYPNQIMSAHFQMDENGKKFINLHGRKLRVVPQGEIPDVVRRRTIQLKSQLGSLHCPLKVRILRGAKSAETPDKPSKKILISNNLLQTAGDSGDDVIQIDHDNAAVSVNPNYDAPENCCDQCSNNTNSVKIELHGAAHNKKPKLLTQKNLKILNKIKMQALNLSLKREIRGTAEVGVQTDNTKKFEDTKKFESRVIQTDIQKNCQEQIEDIFDFDLLCFLDDKSPIVRNNVNFGVGPSMGKIESNSGYEGELQQTAGKYIINAPASIGTNQKLESDARMEMQVQFFRDLRQCLTPNLDGNCLIHEGVINNDLLLVRRMCTSLKARRVGVNLENHDGCTPLQLTVINDCASEIVQVLLDYGADPLEVDGDGNNILHLAVKFQRYQVLYTILQHPLSLQQKNYIDSFNFEGLTPLMICCTSCWSQGAVLLLECHANVNLRDQTSGRTALFHAAEAHCSEIVLLLLEHKADAKIKNFFGTSPHDAMYELEEMPDIIKHLIFGKTKKRSIEAEMHPAKTAKAAKIMGAPSSPPIKPPKPLRTFSKLQKIQNKEIIPPNGSFKRIQIVK